MKTTSINVMNLCVPCECHCRYCLLSWSNRLLGIDYERSVAYASRFYEWIKKNRPDLQYAFYFGYSMEHPKLLESIDFMRSVESPGGEMLQFDGMKFRNNEEIRALLTGIMEHGIKHINMTIYGTEEYHDRFAARKGDFRYLIRILAIANELGLPASVGIPLNQENANQIDELVDFLQQYTLTRLSIFVPHSEGRGATLDSVRFRQEDFENLQEKTKKYFNPKIYRTEAEWVAFRDFVSWENRLLTISLTPENVEMFENMNFEQAISYLEELDENYYNNIPSLEALVEQYGDKENTQYYSQRDLYLKYQRMYIKEHQLDIYDVNDERQCFSRHY